MRVVEEIEEKYDKSKDSAFISPGIILFKQTLYMVKHYNVGR